MSHETKQGATDQDQVQVTWVADGRRRRVALRAGVAELLLSELGAQGAPATPAPRGRGLTLILALRAPHRALEA